MALIGYYGHRVALSVHLGQWAAIASYAPLHAGTKNECIIIRKYVNKCVQRPTFLV